MVPVAYAGWMSSGRTSAKPGIPVPCAADAMSSASSSVVSSCGLAGDGEFATAELSQLQLINARASRLRVPEFNSAVFLMQTLTQNLGQGFPPAHGNFCPTPVPVAI